MGANRRLAALAAHSRHGAVPTSSGGAAASGGPPETGAWLTAATPDDRAAIKEWFDVWGAHVAAKEFEPAADKLFAADAMGFGTWMDFVEGLDNLVAKQWKSVWPTISGFHHRTEDALQVTVSPDRLMAVGLVLWTSTGFAEDGSEFERPGRTTAVFNRASIDDEWRCVHTHVSLARGVPQQSHGGS
jgi:ketosteroid isomerase-like protein